MGFINTQGNGFNEITRASSIQAEKAYIGSLLASASCGESQPLKLSIDDFYDSTLSKIYQVIKDIVTVDKALPEVVLVRQKLLELGLNGNGFNNQSLVDLMEGDFNYHNISRYEFAIKDCKRRRETETLINELSSDESKDSSMLMKMGQKLIGLATSSSGVSNKGISTDAMNSLYEKIAENEGKSIFGFSFGENLKFLDYATKGIQKGKTYRIGAPSNVGKSQLTYTIINNVLAQGANVAFFTLENDSNSTLSFLMSNYQKVNNDKILNGEIPGDFDYLLSVQDRLTIIEDMYDINNIFTRILELQPDIVILDYIGLVGCKGFTDETKYTEYATQVQRFIKATQVSWIDLSNLPTQLQQAEDIKINPQFFGSTFLRNNTDVGIHITPNKKFYELRSKIFENGDDKYIEMYKYISGVTITISKNRLGPHSISKEYKVDYTKGGEWTPMTPEFISNLELHAI